jgi:REP element-mobilizing transposase RayT
MPNYRRAFRPGGTFFYTLITYQRSRFLCDELAQSLRRIMRFTRFSGSKYRSRHLLKSQG